MSRVKATITHFAENYPPGLVGCEFIDIEGVVHRFVEKFYDVSNDELDQNSIYPLPGTLECEVIDRWRDNEGREVVEIETPCHRLEDQTRFRVFANQLHDYP